MLEETLRKGNALQSQIAMSNAVLDDYEKLKDEDGFHLRINVLANGSRSDVLGIPVDDSESIEKIIAIIREYRDKRQKEFDEL